MNTNTPPEQTALNKTEFEAVQSIALQLDVVIGQILLDHDHDHGLVVGALLGAYVKQVTRCPGCTETASLLLPVVGSQLKAIAAAMVKPADKPLH